MSTVWWVWSLIVCIVLVVGFGSLAILWWDARKRRRR